MLSPFFVASARSQRPSAGRRHDALRNRRKGTESHHIDLRVRYDAEEEDEDAGEDTDDDDDDDLSPNPLLNSAGDSHSPSPTSTTFSLSATHTPPPLTDYDPSNSNLPMPLHPPQTTSTTVPSTTFLTMRSTSPSLPSSTAPVISDQTETAPVEAQAYHGNKLYYLPGGVKVGIAFGIIAAATFLVSLIWACVLYRHRRRQKTRGHRLADDANVQASEPRKLWPFSRTGPLPRSHARSQSAICNSVFAASYRNDPFSPHPGRRIPTVDMGTYTGAPLVSRAPSGGARQTLSDEKRAEALRPISLLPPEPVTQPDIRGSIASWFRRSGSHHPLLLNPMSGRLSVTSTVVPRDGSRRGSVSSSISGRRTSEYGQGGVVGEDVPPVPTVPKEVFTGRDAAACYRSVWSDSTPSEGGTESKRVTVVSTAESERGEQSRRETLASCKRVEEE